MDLNGTAAIVTGGNGGLGQRICRALARAGANVAVVYNVSEDQARGVAAELREAASRPRRSSATSGLPSRSTRW